MDTFSSTAMYTREFSTLVKIFKFHLYFFYFIPIRRRVDVPLSYQAIHHWTFTRIQVSFYVAIPSAFPLYVYCSLWFVLFFLKNNVLYSIVLYLLFISMSSLLRTHASESIPNYPETFPRPLIFAPRSRVLFPLQVFRPRTKSINLKLKK